MESREIKNISYPELDSGTLNGSRNKFGMTSDGALRSSESGRSMVEMLGVLAIIGVLTIGGLAGYNYGMNRYRTNEIVDGSNKRAYTVSTQISLGIPLNLSEFNDENETAGGTFQPTVQSWTGEFGIQVNGVRQEVCENLLRMVGPNTQLRAITTTEDATTALTAEDCGEDNNLYLIYNFDMGIEKNSKESIDTGNCESGNVYLSYNTGNECGTSTPMNTKSCSYAYNCGSSNDFCCINNICVLADRYESRNGYCPIETTCKKNSDCPAEYFCGFGNASKSQDKPDTGNCLSIHNISEKIYNEHTFLVSEGFPMSWWSAENWCKKNGARLAKLSDFGNITGTCSGTTCTGITWQQFKTAIGDGVYWIENATSSKGYVIFAGNNKIDNIDHNNMGVGALCFKN